jgi:hypothetical protein
LAARLASLDARVASFAAARLAAIFSAGAAETATATAERERGEEATFGQQAVTCVSLPQRRQLSFVNLKFVFDMCDTGDVDERGTALFSHLDPPPPRPAQLPHPPPPPKKYKRQKNRNFFECVVDDDDVVVVVVSVVE